MSASTAAILVIGDEILSGKTEEQNARFLISQLRELGVALRCILTVPDEIETIAQAACDLATRFDHVFTSGGVGPTHDDVTIRAIAQAFNRPVIRHTDLEARLRNYFGDKTEESHLRMADVPEGARLIDMPDLKWPVLACENIYILPGVPDLFRLKFLAIRERFRVEPFFMQAIFTREDEFDFAEALQQLAAQHPEVSIGSYPNFVSPEYRVRLTLESKNETALESAVNAVKGILDPAQLVKSE